MSFYETRELHSKEAFRTHWYQARYEEIKEAIFKMADDLGYVVVDVNDTFKEMLLEGAHVVIVKITSYNRYEQGVDFNISTNWFFDFGRGKKVVSKLYNQIGKYVKFKGISLHP